MLLRSRKGEPFLRGAGREKGQTANAIGALRSRVKRNLRLASTRKPVGDDYAPLLGEFRSGQEGAQKRFGAALNLVSREREVDFQRELWATPVSPARGNLFFGRSVVFVAFAIRGRSLIPNTLIA